MKLGDLADNEIGVRMYRAGFGDCFLLSFPGPGRRRKMLVDCGSIAKFNKSMGSIVKQVIADACEGEADGEPRIDIVVCTHRHRDHVAGFAKPGWDKVQVDEVWMPWTENPADPEARRILHEQASLALGLTRRFAEDRFAGDSDLAGFTRRAMTNQDDTADALVDADDKNNSGRAMRIRRSLIALNALSNEKAMNTLHQGFKSDPERYFLPEGFKSVRNGTSGARTRTFRSPALPGAEFHILGPSRDEETIRDMEPPKGESYFRAAPLDEAGTPNARPPFGDEWRVADDEYGNLSSYLANPLDAKDISRIDRLSSLNPSVLAASLDASVNGTSLMFIVAFRGQNLFFPGDAQWGTWRRALDDPEWRALMSRTRLYKVGHHGSHNATPKEYVEDLLPEGGDMAAMVSVRPHGKWHEIPREPLLKAIKERAATVRSDMKKSAVKKPFNDDGKGYVDLVIPV